VRIQHARPPRVLTVKVFAAVAAVMIAGVGGLAAAYVDAQADVAALGDQVRALGAVPEVAPSLPIEPVPGPPGRGVLGTDVVGGRLIVLYSDGTREDAGQVTGQPGVPGEPGPGVTATDVVGGRLIVTYTDDERVDPGGSDDGTVERCTRSGGPDTDPRFECDRSGPDDGPADGPTP
jgi:hypothetical protein